MCNKVSSGRRHSKPVRLANLQSGYKKNSSASNFNEIATTNTHHNPVLKNTAAPDRSSSTLNNQMATDNTTFALSVWCVLLDAQRLR